jgi:shikimate dehydrogenase
MGVPMSIHAVPPGVLAQPASSMAPPRTVLLGLIGTGILKSKTPPMQMREASEQGLTCIYQVIDLDVLRLGIADLPDLLIAAERMGFAGVNITHPCKQAVIPLLDELSPNADALGAVNTVLFRDGRRSGHNTDWCGFKWAFERDFADVARERVVMFGAGGAGSAVAHALMMLGVGHLTIVDVEEKRARTLADQMGARHGANRLAVTSDGRAAVSHADGVVNATPIGMAHHPGTPFPPDWLKPRQWLMDVIYIPAETELLAAARAIGCRVMNGGGMAVFQAVRAFELFTGQPADAARMSRHFASL